MARLRRKIFWIGGLALLFVLVSGAYLYFIGTKRLLEHAEAWNFRRMTVATLAEKDKLRFFFATNRAISNQDGSFEDRFKNERIDVTSFGSFDTIIKPTLGLGMIIDPSSWFLNEEIRLSGMRILPQEDFQEELGKQVKASPGQSLMIVVHGFREAFPSALRKTAFLGHILDIDTPVLVFDWPGNQGSSLRGYRRARNVAGESGKDLAALLRSVIEEIRPERLWLIANSMGGEVVVEAFSDLAKDPDLADADIEIEDIILTAPDVSREKFNNQFKHDLKSLAGNTTVYVSSNDRALLASRLINRSARLGESTLDPSNPSQIEEAEGFAKLLEPGEDRLVLVDVTAVNRTRNFHNFSLETPEFFDDLFLRLTGSDLPQTRELYDIETPDGSRYFVLTRGR
jgi:esterase/lipase superfamily enzyme